MKRKIIIIFLLLSVLLVACRVNSETNSPTSSKFTPSIENYKGSVFSTVIGTDSTKNAGRIGSSLVLQNINEPIDISFGQTGRDREFGLTIYYDYRPIQFKIGREENYIDRFKFSIKDSEKINMSLYLNDSEVIPDDLCHFLTFIFTPSPNEYAKDKKNVTYNSAQVYNYNLYFNNYDESKKFVNSNYTINTPYKYYPYESNPLILNTNITNEIDASEEVFLPDKCYRVNTDSLFEMNYILSNPEGNSQTAILFLEIGNEHVRINDQEYIYIDLNNELMANDKLTFLTPKEPGLYDVIGFVVYDPFLDINSNLNQIPETSVRFTLEVVEKK